MDTRKVGPVRVSSSVTSPRAADFRRPLVAVARATSGDRWLAWTLLGILVPWLAYTRLYFFLQPRHLTFDGGFFMWYLHKPDPFCGGTRTFAWMWRGDLGHAVAVYPLGPLLFLASISAVMYALVVLVSGRAVQLSPSRAVMTATVTLGLVALGLNWAAKWFWLGM